MITTVMENICLSDPTGMCEIMSFEQEGVQRVVKSIFEDPGVKELLAKLYHKGESIVIFCEFNDLLFLHNSKI